MLKRVNKRSDFNDIDFILHKIWANNILLFSGSSKERGNNVEMVVEQRGKIPAKQKD